MDPYNSSLATSTFFNPGLQTHPIWDSSILVPAVVLSLCFCVGVPGNITVIILRPNWEHLSSLSQTLMLNLAVFDLLCLLTLPVWIHTYLHGWVFSSMSCKLLEGFVYCSVYGSLLTVTGLSVQRYLVVVHHLKSHKVQERLMLVLLWLVAFVLSVPALVVQQLVTNQLWDRCQPVYTSEAQWMAVLLTESLLGIVLYSVVTFSYVRLKKQINRSVFFNNPQTNRLVTSIIVSLFVLWFPYIVTNLLGIAGLFFRNEDLKEFYISKRRITAALLFVNSSLNPLLYAFTSSKVCFFCLTKKPVRENQQRSQTPDNTTVELSYCH